MSREVMAQDLCILEDQMNHKIGATKTFQLPSIRLKIPLNKDYDIPIKGSWKV